MSAANERTWAYQLGHLAGCLNLAQRVVVAVAAVLLLAIFAFPYTTYLAVQEAPVDPASLNLGALPPGTTAKRLDFQTREGFRPLWEPLAPPSADAMHGVSFALGIRWPIVLSMAGAVLILAGAALVLFRSRASRIAPAQGESVAAG
jgi:hypothetical protein